MDIENSIIYKDYLDIVKNGETETNFNWKLIILIPDGNNVKEYIPFKMIGLTIKRDYINNFSDVITCRCLIPNGDYEYEIYENRNNLKAILIKEKLNEKTAIQKNILYNSNIYDLILLNEENTNKNFSGIERTSKEVLNTAAPKYVDFQLINSNILSLLKIQFSTVFYKTNIKNLISGFINYCTKLNNNVSKPLINKIDIVDPDNKTTLNQFLVPDNVRLLDVPSYMQKEIGVYNTKLGSYIQNDVWYIYPIFDTTRFKNTDNVTLYILPKFKSSNLERTYIAKDSKRILITGDSIFKDDNATNVINTGDGASFVDADKLFNDPSSIENGKLKINRKDNSYEYVTSTSSRDFNFAPITNEDNVTNNFFEKNSNINSKTGGIFKAIWQSADFNLLRPGISARILYDENGILKEYNGTLIYAEYVSLVLGGFEANRYTNHAMLHFYINKGNIK